MVRQIISPSLPRFSLRPPSDLPEKGWVGTRKAAPPPILGQSEHVPVRRPIPAWQTKLEGGHTIDRFEVDWEQERVRCPQGRLSSA
jgi:hypothetical protein